MYGTAVFILLATLVVVAVGAPIARVAPCSAAISFAACFLELNGGGLPHSHEEFSLSVGVSLMYVLLLAVPLAAAVLLGRWLRRYTGASQGSTFDRRR